MSRESRTSALLLALWLLAMPVWAQEADDKEDDEKSEDSKQDETRRLEGVEYVEVEAPYAPTSNTIATKLPVPLQETPANVGAVNRTIMSEQRTFWLGQALQNVSGINTQTQSGVTDYFLIRGYNSLDGGLVLTDGAAEPEVVYYPTYNANAVEVLKGPAGFLYGANPLAGAVNIIRKQPTSEDFMVLGLTGGSFNTWEGTVDWNLSSQDGNEAFRLNAMYLDSERYRDDKDARQYAINPTFLWRLGQKSSLNFSVEYLKSEFSPDGGVPLINQGREIADVARTTSYQLPTDFSSQKLGRVQVDFETRISDKILLRNKTFYRGLDWDTRGTVFLGTTPLPPMFGGGNLLSRVDTGLDDRQNFYGNQLESVIIANTGSVQHSVLVGLEIGRQTDDFDISASSPLLDPLLISVENPVEMSTNVLLFPFQVGDYQVDIVAPYVLDQMKFSDKFQMMVGARYDNIDTDVTFDVNNNPLDLGLEGFNRDDSEVSPMLGLLGTPSQSLSVYASASQSHAPIGPRVAGAKGLDPEQSTQFELGVKKQFGSRLRTTFALYQLDRENIPITDPGGITQQPGDQSSHGFEVELGFDPSAGLHVLFSYAYNDSELTSFGRTNPFTRQFENFSGNVAPFAPKNIANAWVSQRFKNGLGVAGGLRFVDEQFIDADNVFALDSYLLLDAAVFYDISDWRLKLNLKNLTDQDYEVRGDGNVSVIPADPFTIFAGVEVRL